MFCNLVSIDDPLPPCYDLEDLAWIRELRVTSMGVKTKAGKKKVPESSLLVLKKEAFKRFEKTMSNPPEPNDKLRKAAQAKRPWA